jgi:predicted Fe-Mo cluster-binding NifX family protein
MNSTQRVAVPTEGPGGLDAPRSMHFGHAESFTLIDVAEGRITGMSVLVNPPHQHGGCGSTVGLLVEAGSTTVIAGGMGGGPRSGLAAAGIEVCFDATTTTARAAVDAYLAGTRESFDEQHVCRGH